MKKFLTLLSLVPATIFAQVPNEINVYSSVASGAKTNICRAIFEDYAEKYNSKINFVIKPGAEGLIATKEMFDDKKFSLLCGGPSEKIFNNYVYPGNELLHEKLYTVTLVSVGPIIFTTKPESPYKNLIHLLENKKDINVGYSSNAIQFIVNAGLDKIKINWIPFKVPGDAVPSILNGDLDFYISAGSLEELTRSGRLKSLGYVNGPNSTIGENLTDKFPVMSTMPIFISLGISSEVDKSIILELNKRLAPIINKNEKVNLIYKNTQQISFTKSVEESNRIINEFKKIVREKYKK